MTRILLTGGRAPATLDLARMLHRAGHTVFMGESLPLHLSSRSRAIAHQIHLPPPRQQFTAFRKALNKAITTHKIEWLIPTCEELFHVARAKPTLSSSCTVFTADIDQLDRLHNKWAFIQRSQALALSVPQTRLLTSPAAAYAAQEKWGTEWVLKPAYSRFATETIIRPSHQTNFGAFDISPQRPWVGQQFTPGRQICTYSIAHAGRLTLHTAYETRYTAGQGATIAFTHLDHPAVQDWVERFVAAEQFTGQIAFDFIETAEQTIFAIECNPRLTSGIHHFAQTPNMAAPFFTPDTPLITPQEPTAATLPLALLGAAPPITHPASQWSHWANTLIKSRNIILDRHDPIPWFYQPVALAYLLWAALRHKISPLEATTHDISWHGERHN